MNRQTRFDETAVENFLAITYGEATYFLALSLLYDKTRWGEESVAQGPHLPAVLVHIDCPSRSEAVRRRNGSGTMDAPTESRISSS